nr:hypothetical protein [Spelaeibacter cavernicola]
MKNAHRHPATSRDHTAQEQPRRRTGRGHEGIDPDRAGACRGLVEQRHDHAECDRRGHRGTAALDESCSDQSTVRGGKAARERRDGEDDQTAEQHPAPPDQVTEPTGEQQQGAETDQVGVHDPGQLVGSESEITLDGRDRNVHDRLVQHGHHRRRAQHDQRSQSSTGECR